MIERRAGQRLDRRVLCVADNVHHCAVHGKWLSDEHAGVLRTAKMCPDRQHDK